MCSDVLAHTPPWEVNRIVRRGAGALDALSRIGRRTALDRLGTMQLDRPFVPTEDGWRATARLVPDGLRRWLPARVVIVVGPWRTGELGVTVSPVDPGARRWRSHRSWALAHLAAVSVRWCLE